MRHQHEMETEDYEHKKPNEEVQALKERIKADIQPQKNDALEEPTTCQGTIHRGIKPEHTNDYQSFSNYQLNGIWAIKVLFLK